MARRRRRSKRTGGKNKGSDWSDNMSGLVWKLLEAIPVIGNFVSQFQEDPNTEYLSEIADAVGVTIPELLDQQNFLHDLQAFIGHQAARQNKVLEDMSNLLKDYSRPDIFGQLAAYSTLAAAVAQIKRLADNTEKMAGALSGIDENLKSINARGEYFPDNVHSYIRMKINHHSNDVIPHYFAVFNKSTLWHPKFADIQCSSPLGPRYLGHKTDLDELCAFLVEEVRPRIDPKAVLHILMPTIGQLALCEAVKFPEEMRPFLIEGQLGDAGSPFVYICTTEQEDKACLRDIGVLKPRGIWEISAHLAFQVPFIMARPFVASPGRKYFVDPSFRMPINAECKYRPGPQAWYAYLGPEPPRTLGHRTRRPWAE